MGSRWLATIAVGVLGIGVVACGGRTDAARATPTSPTMPPTSTSTSTSNPSPTSTSAGHPAPAIRTVRRIELTFVDPSRSTVARPPLPATGTRVLRTTVFVPSPGAGPWPLVVFGHGFDNRVSRYEALLERVALSGFVVAAPELPGSSSALAGTPDERDLRDEPCDLLYVAAKVQHAPASEVPVGLVRGGPVALAGQSDGATAAAFAALTDPVGRCGGPPVAGVVAFSADPVPVRPGAAATVLAVTGSADTVNPPAHTRALFDEAPPPSYLLTSAGDDHLQPSTDSPHRQAIDSVVVDYLRMTLLGDRAAAVRLLTDAHRPGLHLERRSRAA